MPPATATQTAERQAPLPLKVVDAAGSLPVRQVEGPETEVLLTQRADMSLIEALTRLENAEEIFKRRAQLLESCHIAALKRTRPADWVLTKDREGAETAMLTVSGADLIAEVYGIVMRGIGPTNERGEFAPEKTPVPGLDGVYSLRAYCSAFSRVNGRAIELLEFSRRSDEDFTGRSVTNTGKLTTRPADSVGALESDLRGAVLTGMRTKVVRVLCGMTRVPVSELAKAWEGTPKKVEACRKGHGYGTSSDRGAKGVADADVPAARETLKKAILSAVGGDLQGARELTIEITSNKAKNFKGFDSVDRLTQGWQIEQATRNLKAHPTFGDAGREPGADDEG
jgi:hypothetical protein